MTVLDCAQLYNIVVAEMKAVHRLSWEGVKDHMLCRARLRHNLPWERFNHYLANEHDRARTLKRGGNINFISLHEHMAESEKTLSVNNGLGSVDSYDQSWATTMVSRAWEHLQQSLASEDQARWFEELKPFLFGGATPPRPRSSLFLARAV